MFHPGGCQPSASETLHLCVSTRGPDRDSLVDCANVESRNDLADDMYPTSDVWTLLVDASGELRNPGGASPPLFTPLKSSSSTPDLALATDCFG